MAVDGDQPRHTSTVAHATAAHAPIATARLDHLRGRIGECRSRMRGALSAPGHRLPSSSRIRALSPARRGLLPLVHCGSGRDRCASGCAVAECVVGCVDGSPLRRARSSSMTCSTVDRRSMGAAGPGRTSAPHASMPSKRSDAELVDAAARRERPARAADILTTPAARDLERVG